MGVGMLTVRTAESEYGVVVFHSAYSVRISPSIKGIWWKQGENEGEMALRNEDGVQVWLYPG